VQDIVGLRPDVASVALESGGGSVGSAAARSAAVSLVAELQAARALSAGSADVAPEDSASKMRELLRRDDNVRQDLSALRSVRWPSRLQRAPLYRSYRIAADTAVRAALWLGLASVCFVWAGWSAASASLYLVAAVTALGVTTPNPRGYSTIALVGAPIAVVLAGILEFIVLNGADVFPVLAIALAPFTISAALLVPSKNPVWSGLGRINLIAIPTNSDEGGDLKRIRELEFQRTCRGLDEQGQKELDELTSKYPNQNADCELATAIRDKLM
jgi:Fusaric acid resistance protein family